MILLSWECPPRLNQAFDAEKGSGSSIWNNTITRRSFLKRSGAATVAVMVAAQSNKANAEGGLDFSFYSMGDFFNTPSDASASDCVHVWTTTYSGYRTIGGIQQYVYEQICNKCQRTRTIFRTY